MEGDIAQLNISTHTCNFYPRPHMEGDELGDVYYWGYGDFYPRPHMEGDVGAGGAGRA